MSAFTGHLPGSAPYRRLLVGLFFAGVATFAQLYSPQAVLPLIADDLRVSPASAALSVSACTIGLAAAVIPWSMVADRIGRVPAMAIGVVAASVLGFVAPFSGDIAVFLGIRLAEGIALGAVPAVALAYLSEEVDAGHTATAAGAYIAGTTVGGLTGRLVSGPVGDLVQWRAGMWATAAVCALAALVFVVLVPRSRGFTRRAAAGILSRLAVNLRSRGQLALYAQAFLLMGAFVAMYNYLGFHLIADPFALAPWVVTLLFLAYLAGTVSSPWAGMLASRHGRLRILLAAIAVMAMGAALTAVPWLPAILAGLLVFTGGFFAAQAVASGWAPASARRDARAQASSLYYLGYYVGSSLFGWCLGFVFAGVGWGWFVTAVVAMCLAAAATAWWALRAPQPGLSAPRH